MFFQVTDTTFDNQGDTSITADDPGTIVFQDCQFFVNTVIYITSETSSSIVYAIRMVNCKITKTTPIPRYNWDWVIKTSENVSLTLWNLTIGINNTYYTASHEEFGYHTGDDIDIAVEDFDNDFTDFNVKELYFTSGSIIDIHNFLPNHGRILPGLAYNGSQH